MNKAVYYLLILALVGTAQANLVVNGDFENDWTGWFHSIGNSWLESNEGSPASTCVRFETGDGSNADARSQLIAISDEGTLGYSINSGMWQDTSASNYPVLLIRFYDQSEAIVSQETIAIYSEANDWWGVPTVTSGQVAIPTGVAYVDVVINSNGWQGGARFDDVTLYGQFAWDPTPANGAQDVGTVVDGTSTTVELSWKTGLDISDPTAYDPNVAMHYLHVNDGTGWAIVDEITASGSTGAYTLSGLTFNKDYLWRVDEGVTLAGGGVSGPDDAETVVGPVWSFVTHLTLSIIEQPETIAANAGSDVSFIVVAETEFGSPISYQWYKSADDVIDSGDQALDSQATLTLAAVDLTDEAYYYCAVTSGDLTLHTDVVSLGIRRKLAHWSLDDTDYTGTQYVDLTNEGNNANVNGTPVFVDGFVNGDQDPNSWKTNGAVEINETAGWADVGAFNPAAYSDQFTISGWFRWTQHSGTDPAIDWNTLVSKRDNWSSTEDNMFMILVAGPSKQLVMQSWGDGYVGSGQDSVQPNEWYHFAAVYTGEVGRVYLNGQFAGEAAYPMQGGGDSTFYIGRVGDDVNQRFDGALDDMQVYNYAMTSEEIADTYQIETGETLCLQDKVWYDLTNDCVVDINDFMMLAGEWLDSGMYPAE